jgi:glycosyltransferase involved in cell wall biosynthesis
LWRACPGGGCEACVADLGHFLHEEITVSALRARSAGFLAGARRIITPSDDARTRIKRHFEGLAPVTIPHENDAAIQSSAEVGWVGRAALNGAAGPRLRVCVVGAIGVHKGYDVLLACAQDAARRGLNLEFVVVGTTIDDGRLLSTGHAFVTGGFQPGESVDLIVAQRASLGFVPSIWPETWCLCLGDIWRAGLEAAAFDIGAPAERIRRNRRGFLLPLGLSAYAINNALIVTKQLAHHL